MHMHTLQLGVSRAVFTHVQHIDVSTFFTFLLLKVKASLNTVLLTEWKCITHCWKPINAFLTINNSVHVGCCKTKIWVGNKKADKAISKNQQNYYLIHLRCGATCSEVAKRSVYNIVRSMSLLSFQVPW